MLLTPAAKLQHLIELAHANGWDRKPEECFPGFTTFAMRELMQTDVMFDHAFINALCKAKYDKLNQPGSFLGLNVIVGCNWEHQIKELAISTDRIEYLWQEFGNE